MKVDNEFVKKYDSLIRHILKEDLHIPVSKIDEFTSEVYMRLLSHPSYDEERGPFTTWLKYVIRSVSGHKIEKENRSRDALDNSIDLDSAHNIIGQEDAGTVEDELDRVFNATQVSPQHLEVFKSYHLEGSTRKEIAERFDLPEETVKSILTRVMKALRHKAAE